MEPAFKKQASLMMCHCHITNFLPLQINICIFLGHKEKFKFYMRNRLNNAIMLIAYILDSFASLHG